MSSWSFYRETQPKQIIMRRNEEILQRWETEEIKALIILWAAEKVQHNPNLITSHLLQLPAVITPPWTTCLPRCAQQRAELLAQLRLQHLRKNNFQLHRVFSSTNTHTYHANSHRDDAQPPRDMCEESSHPDARVWGWTRHIMRGDDLAWRRTAVT